MARELTIGAQRIADDAPCYVVAEIGNTHQGSRSRACELVEVAALCGADAVKLQKKAISRLYSAAMLAKPYSGFAKTSKTYGAHKAALELSVSDLAAVQAAGRTVGIAVFATPFDEASADQLEALDVPAYKIHSGGLTDTALLKHVAAFGKPVIVSTGGGTLADIDRAANLVAQRAPMAILHCTAEYPVADNTRLNLGVIATLRDRYPEIVIGWSAHDTAPNTSGISNALVAYGLGARILEKHFTLDHELFGTDHAFSLEPSGLRKLVASVRAAHVVRGDGIKCVYAEEQEPIAKMRRTERDGVWQIRGTHESESDRAVSAT